MVVLDVDIGNTRLKWRLSQQGDAGSEHGFIATAALDRAVLLEAWKGLPQPQRVRFVSVASVDSEQTLMKFCHEQWRLTAQKAKTQAAQAGVVNSYSNFQTMGADRWLVMLAGFHRASKGQHRRGCCVVDCGSAVTVDYVDADGQHLGGFIAPGLRLMRKGLLNNTRQILLPEESQQRFDTRPGRSTEEAVGHGIELMLAALAQRVVKDCADWLGADALLLVTGGDGGRFIDAAGCGEWCADLVLDGLEWTFSE
ncbi:MAG: type III pantothenate kinase [Motiliproteus sp.]